MVAKRALVRFATLMSVVALQACGGGGSDKPASDTTPPTIVSATPADGATGVLRNASFVITFSEPVANATASTVTWTQGATPVAVPFGIAVSGATVTLTPTGSLDNFADQTVTVTTGVTDAAGNPLAVEATYGFKTRDDVAPTVAGTVPADGATAVSRSSTFVITFSEPIAAATANASTITWTQGATPVDFGIGVSGAVVTLTPAGTLAAGAVHTVTVLAGVTDAQGNALAAPASWTFTTLDDVAPTIVSTNPANGATGVARSTTFAITFSEPMALGTLTGNVELFQGGTPVAVAISQSGSVVTLTPSTQPLANFAPFTVQVATDVQDLAGNNLAAGGTFGFTTIDDVAPIFAAAPTDAGAYATSTTVHFSWTAATDAGSGLAASPYWLEARTAPGGGTLLFEASVGTALGADVTAAHGQPVYANVRARDAAGNETWSGWSDGILVDLAAAPVAAAPTSDVTRTNGPILWDWAPVTDPESGTRDYEMQLSSTAALDGSGVYVTFGVATPPWGINVSARPDGSKVYARVRAYDNVGNVSAWTAWSVGVDVDTAGPVFASAPTDDGAFSLPTVYFYWSDPTDPAGVETGNYFLQIATSPNVSDIFWTTPGAVSGAGYNESSYLDGTTFFARVIALDLLGNQTESGWSDGVMIDRLPPPTPAAPSDPGDQQRELDVLFSWAPSADDTSITTNVSGLRDFTIHVKDETEAIVWSTTVGDTSVIFTGQNGHTYRAQLLATDNVGNASIYGPWSDGISINTSAPGTPGVPTDEGAFSADAVLAFSWGVAAGSITGYEVQIAAGVGLTPVAATCDNVGTALSANCNVAPGGLPNGSTYFARVRARDAVDFGGWSDWSDGIVVDTTPPSAPGTPTDNGAFDDTSVRFDWAEATDAESGILTYEAEIFADGSYVGTSFGWVPYTTFDATGREGQNITARVRAQNMAGTWGDWSGTSDGVVVETQGPMVTNRTPGPGWGTIPTNQDFVFQFSEPMDRASVEASFSIACGTGCPKNGLAFVWSVDSTQVTVIPDAADPVGATNVDLLPQSATIGVALGAGATDLAGNPIEPAGNEPLTFRTTDETSPAAPTIRVMKASLSYNQPVPAASVQGGFTVMATFGEDMSAARARARLEVRQGSIEARYSSSPWNVRSAVPNGFGVVSYTLFGCPTAPALQVGDWIAVTNARPDSYNVSGGNVLSVWTVGSDCAFAMYNATTDTYDFGAQVYLPEAGDARVAWIDARTLRFDLPGYLSLPPASEFRVSLSDVTDVAGNYGGGDQVVQIAPLPGTDTVRPTLLSGMPLDGAVGVSRMSPVLLVFTEPLDQSSLAGAWAADAAGNPYELRYSSDEMGPVLFFMPRGAPTGGTRVDVHVPYTVRDLAGNTVGTSATDDLDLSFDVADQTDFDVPVLYESLPPDGRPVDGLWQASANFVDDATGMLERLDVRTVGDEDVRVTDGDTGLLIRGFRTIAESWDGTIRVTSPPRTSGFSTGFGNAGIQAATASGGVATYTTWGSHGLQAGWQVQIQVQGMTGDGCFNTTAVLLDVPSSNTFTLGAPSCGEGVTANNGGANWQTPRTLLVELALAPADGGTGISDFEGNPMDPTGFTALMTPPGSNRVPVVEWLGELRIGATTGPNARALSASFRVRDADNDDVSATITAEGAAGTVYFSNVITPDPTDSDYLINRTLTGTSYGADYRISSDGPPTQTLPPELDDANFPISGYYPFTVTLDDGNGGVTEYVRYVWVWAPADVPAIESIDDGGTVRPVDATRPIVVEASAQPILQWSNVDVANADFIGLQHLELTASNVGGDGGGPAALVLDRSLTSVPYPTPLEPSLYAWFVTQLKFSPGGTNMETQGMSLDFGAMLESCFVYGPDNRAYAGTVFGAARSAFGQDGAGALVSWVGSGTYSFLDEGTGDAPVWVEEGLVRNGVGPTTATELFAAAVDGRFMVTTVDPVMGIPLANRGIVGRDGRFFAVAGQAQSSVSLEAGALRDPAIVFGPDLDGMTLGFIQLETRRSPSTGLLESTGSSVGVAVADPDFLNVTGTRHDGSALSVGGPLPYTLASDGLLTLNIGSPVAGYLGGAPGALMGALSEQSNPDNGFLLIMAQKYAGSFGADPQQFLTGTYRFVEYAVGTDGVWQPDGSTGFGEIHASVGTMTFDGAGGFTYVTVNAGAGTMIGDGTYVVDEATGTVSAVANPTADPVSFLFQVAPDGDTLLGSCADAARPYSPQLLILTR